MKISILKLVFQLCLFISLSQKSETSSLKQSEVKLSKHPVLLVVSYDGFRADYMSKTDTPHLDSLKTEGATVPFMRAQFPTKTFPNHHSIATGLYPESHGVTDNVVYDPTLGLLNGFEDVPNFWNYSSEVQPIWLRNEQAGNDRYSGCYMWAGSPQGYGENSDLFPTYYIPTYNQSVPWENRIDTVISWMTNDIKPANLVFLYYNEPDSQGHEYGTDDEETVAEIRKTDNRTGQLIQKLKDAQIYDKINMIILSDHGMQTVTNDSIIDISRIIPNTTFNYDRYGGTPVAHIQPKAPEDLQKIYDALKVDAATSNFTVYKKEELGHLHYTNNRRIMDLIVLADPGFGFEDISNNFNEKGNYGVHGYDNTSPNMSAFFVARGPLFKKAFETSTHIENVDIFSLISKIMSFPPAPNNGSLTIVSQLLEPVDNSNGGENLSSVSFKIMLSLVFLAQFSFPLYY